MIRYIARNDDKICHTKVIILIIPLLLYVYIVWPSDLLSFAFIMDVVILVFLHFAAKSSLAQFFSILQMQKKNRLIPSHIFFFILITSLYLIFPLSIYYVFAPF